MARARKTVGINPDSPNARLAQAIQELKVTQAEVGRRTKVGAPYINDLVRARRSVSEPFAEYLQSEFGINKVWLRYGEGPMFQEVPAVTLWASMRSMSFRLWDEQRKMLVGYCRLREFRRERSLTARP